MDEANHVRNATAGVVAVLRGEILTGALQGGEPVREQDVAERLGVSRTPVREAVSRLVAEGLLSKDGNRTAHVFRPSLEELLEIYEIRVPLESLAARLACEARDEEFLAELRTAGKALSRARAGLDWSARHEEFHLCLARGSRRPRLTALVHTLRVQSEPYVRFAVTVDDDLLHQAQEDHLEIVRLAEAGDGRGLERLVRKHLKSTAKRVSALLADPQRPVGSGFALPT
ncbi:MAG TPA: GntR family transcriptional regulator [Mycobacteriales bacterium]|jgi:DNA-binding GntR family transcriptional regulator